MPLGATASTNRMKAGTCPHGLPLGACPICNGMAGGNSTTKRDIPRNVGEMTYNQCAAIGAMLRAQKHAKEQAKLAQRNHIQALVDFQKNLASVHQRLMDLKVMITEKLPPIIAKPLNFVLGNVVIRVLNFVQNLPVVFANISQTFAQITDKLTAVFGELKAAIKEKVSKFLTDVKKKIKKLFFVFGAFESDDEDKKIDEAKRTFELKTLLHEIGETLKRRKETEKDEH
ncbi:MAG: hypothetical protein ACI37Q_02260 [Candidatus Gastranaerophilaceae bacterium]